MTVNKSVKDEDYLRKNDWFLPFKFVDVLCSQAIAVLCTLGKK